MGDIVCLRKKRMSVGRKHSEPKACIAFPRGEFRFYQLALDLMNIDRNKQGLMFYLNKKTKVVKIVIENKEPDNYWLSDAKGYYRFTSKELGILFSETLQLEFNGNHYFLLSKLNDNEFEMKVHEN